MVPETVKPVVTRGKDGEYNGWLLPIWNATESDYRPDQLYLTVVNPGCVKGPHLHLKRAGRFVCVKGNVKIVTRTLDAYTEHFTGDEVTNGFQVVSVPPGVAAAIYNVGDVPAYVLNMPTPAWTPEDQDDNPVIDWEYANV